MMLLARSLRSPRTAPAIACAVALSAALVAVGCGDEATQSDTTTGKRITLHGKIEADPEIQGAFVTGTGWSVSLKKAAVAVGSLHYFDGPPAFVLAPRTPRERLAALLGVPAANAHPGHYVAGSALGQMLTPTSYDLFSGSAALPEGDGVTGTFRSARFTFGNPPAGPAAAALGSHVAIAEGVATKAPKTVYFRIAADFANVEKSVAAGQVEGCVVDEIAVTDTGTITVVVKPSIWFNLVDFADVAPGSEAAPTEIATGDTAQIGFALGLVQLTAYHFHYTK